jgi:hypothetical protein
VKDIDPNKEFKEHFDQQKFEHELINRHVTWLLTSQTILIAAYGLIIKDCGNASKDLLKYIPIDPLLRLIPYCGLLTSLSLFIGIVSLILAKFVDWRDYQSLVEKKVEGDRPPWGIRTWITFFALVPDVLLPLIFSIFWALILKNIKT